MATEESVAAAASPDQVEAAFLGAMDALDTMLGLQDQLSGALKQGWFNLSRARYHLGANRVGPLQYPSTMTATATLAVTPDSVESSARSLTEAPKFVLNEPAASSMEDLSLEEAQATDTALNADAWGEGLRRRGGSGHSAPSSLGARLTIEPSTSEQRQRPSNPLNWFGALVPPVLREAQQDFSSALSMAVELADAVAALETSRRTYAAGARDDHSQTTAAVDTPQTDTLQSDIANGDVVKRKGVHSVIMRHEAKTRDNLGSTNLMEELAVKYGAVT